MLRERIAELEVLDTAALRASWKSAWRREAPKAARRRFLMLGIAWKWQAEILGGFSPELARRLSALEKPARPIARPTAEALRVSAAARLAPGTRLIRDWRGERHEVHVTERGYLWQGRSYNSLSAVTKAITGVSRNGPHFFGLRDRKAVR